MEGTVRKFIWVCKDKSNGVLMLGPIGSRPIVQPPTGLDASTPRVGRSTEQTAPAQQLSGTGFTSGVAYPDSGGTTSIGPPSQPVDPPTDGGWSGLEWFGFRRGG